MEASSQKPYKRKFRSVLIHKPIQREFTLVVISLLIISALAIGFVIHSTIHQAMMGGGYRFGTISPYEVMSDLRYDLITRVSLVLFTTIFIIALFGLFFLHRIAGPVYRFQSILRRISRGEIPSEFRLREGDFFSETAEDLNRVLRLLRGRQEHLAGLRKRLEEAMGKKVGEPSLLAELRDALEKLS